MSVGTVCQAAIHLFEYIYMHKKQQVHLLPSPSLSRVCVCTRMCVKLEIK